MNDPRVSALLHLLAARQRKPLKNHASNGATSAPRQPHARIERFISIHQSRPNQNFINPRND
jgi:hypothetical protein